MQSGRKPESFRGFAQTARAIGQKGLPRRGYRREER